RLFRQRLIQFDLMQSPNCPESPTSWGFFVPGHPPKSPGLYKTDIHILLFSGMPIITSVWQSAFAL
ncbi:MAG: hypothetical protein V4455_00380, partial [Pseudomonadota bacterium]